MKFIGKNTEYLTADGQRQARLHLDGAASPLASEVALETIQKLLPHYSNSHSYVHSSAQISTKALKWAHDTIIESLGATLKDHTAIFSGSGTTAISNRLARGLASARHDKKIVLVSSMEHHANDLPHRQFGNTVVYIPLKKSSHDTLSAHLGAIDLAAFESLCQQHSQNINYVAVSSVSNVTGIINPIKEITEIAHKHGALVIIDAAQSVAHMPSDVNKNDIDFMMFSGHKVYTPTAPGVLVAKKDLLRQLPSHDLGGGSVASVSFYDYQLLDSFPDREQAGTPNIIGAIALATVIKQLYSDGLDNALTHSFSLTKQLIDGLLSLPEISVYGDLSLPRVGAITFNHRQIDHGLFAAILNDYFSIAVRNECFCAHPYVSDLLKEELWELDLDNIDEPEQESFINRKRGMVRASVSLYTDELDIERFLVAVKTITTNINDYKHHYQANPDGSYSHTSFVLDWQNILRLP